MFSQDTSLFFTFFSFISTKNIVYWGVAINNIMIVSGEPRRDSAIDIYICTPSPHPGWHITLSSMCYTVGACWLSIYI